MDMTWNTSTRGMCIVFKSWRIQTAGSFVMSLAVVFAFGVAYEYLKQHVSQLDSCLMRRDDTPSRRREVLPKARDQSQMCAVANRPVSAASPARLRALRAVAYGASVALSIFLMLVMMTYNAWFIAAVVAGAAAGSYLCSRNGPPGIDKTALCH